MSEQRRLQNQVRAYRIAGDGRRRSLRSRAAISRAGVSAIEMGRLVPSATAVLALAAAFECRVEDLFSLVSEGQTTGRVGLAARGRTLPVLARQCGGTQVALPR